MFYHNFKAFYKADIRNINIVVNEDGYYSLLGEVALNYSENGLSYISINDPILLSFSVSSEYNNGVWILNLDEGEKILTDLNSIASELSETGDTDLQQKVESIIDILSYSGPYTKAST